MERKLFIVGGKVLFALVLVFSVGCSPSNLKQRVEAFQAAVPKNPVVSDLECRDGRGEITFSTSVVKEGGDSGVVVYQGDLHACNVEGLSDGEFCRLFFSIRGAYLDALISDSEIISAYTKFERAAQLCMEIWGYCDCYLYPVPGRSQAEDLADGRPVSQITKEIRDDLGIELTGSPSREWISFVLKETARRSEALLKLL